MPVAEVRSIPPAFSILDEEFLTIEGLSALSGKTERTINWWREKKQGPPYVKVGRTVLYRKSAFLKWLVDQEITPRKSRKAGAR
jgi:predicted DNA-binding transcriptional regulator AlpA